MKVGVFLARMQPLHNGHLGVIKLARKQNDRVVVFIGSNDKSGTKRNPIHGELRKEILEESLIDIFGLEDYEKSFEIHLLNDWSAEDDFDGRNEWGKYLYYNIVSRVGEKDFNIYFSDNPQIMLSWFDNDMRHRINFTFLDREEMEDGISATKVRLAIKKQDKSVIETYCPETVQDRLEDIRMIIAGVE